VGELADTYNAGRVGGRAVGAAAVESVKGGMGSAAGWEVAMRVELSVEGEEWQNRFAEILAVMDTEQLIRFRHRLGKKGYERTVKILTLEIARREE
jgi:hypothetical protein